MQKRALYLINHAINISDYLVAIRNLLKVFLNRKPEEVDSEFDYN